MSALQALLTRTVPVSGLLLFSVVVVLVLEALAVLVLAKVRAGVLVWTQLRGVVLYSVHPLTGSDKLLSWSKIVTGLIVLGYWVKGATGFMPQGVAYAVIAAAHGTKVLLALIANMKVNVDAKESLSYAKSVVEQVTHFRDKSTGEPMPGAPGQPLPATAPA